MKTFEDEEVNPDEEEGNYLDPVFEEGKEWSVDLTLGGESSSGCFPNSEEEEWTSG